MEILPAQPDDLPALVENFKRHRFALEKREWLDWKYGRNPYGAARVFKLVQDGAIAGSVALLHRVFWHHGRRLIGIQAVDGLMGREIRGKGLFNEVMAFVWRQRPADESAPHFHLGFASLPASVKALAFAGWERLADFRLWTFVIDPGVLGRTRALRWAPPLLRPFWRTGRTLWLGPRARGVEALPLARFTEDQTGLFPADRVHGERSPEFLNWRALDNPMDRIRAFQLREAGASAGYVVVKDLGRTWEVMDMRFAAPRERYLLAFLARVAADRLVDSVDVAILPSSSYESLLRRTGFFRRGTLGSMFVKGAREVGLPADPRGWEINPIDSDW